MSLAAGSAAARLGTAAPGDRFIAWDPLVAGQAATSDVRPLDRLPELMRLSGYVSSLRDLETNVGLYNRLRNTESLEDLNAVVRFLFGRDLPTIDRVSKEIAGVLEPIRGSQGVLAWQIRGKDYLEIHIDRDKAAAMQINASQSENALYDAYGPRWVSTIYGSVNEYKVLLELKPEYQADPKALSLLEAADRKLWAEPDPARWETEVAYLISDNQPAAT